LDKDQGLLGDRKAVSPVVASIILCSAVLVIGISISSFTYSVSTNLQISYYDEIKKDIDTISERFTVEHIAYDEDAKKLHVWVFNYGNTTEYSVDIEVKVSVWGNGTLLGESDGFQVIPSGKIVEITTESLGSLSAGSELVVKVNSRRQNVAYQTYVVPTA